MCILSPIEELHFAGWYFILMIQNRFENYAEWFLFMNKIGDPRYAFLLYFPITFAVHRPTGRHVLWIACLSEWMNAVSKWCLHGERPYWWVPETFHWKTVEELHEVNQLPKQFYLTCETGPGSPSGHVMITGAVLYILFAAFIKHQVSQQRQIYAMWSLFGVIMLAIGLSRVYIATHFPHQAVAGILAGISLGETLKYRYIENLGLHYYVLCGCLLAIGAGLTFYGITLFGINPMWSIALAQKWCADPNWVHLDTTLFFSIIRDISCLLGFGIGDYCAKKLGVDNQSTSTKAKILQVCMNVLLVIVIERITIPHNTETVFYVTGSVKYLGMLILLTTVLPLLLKVIGLSTEQAVKQD